MIYAAPEVFVLLGVFIIKHFLADYPLQTRYMLTKGQATGWLPPLAAHCAVHGVATILILAVFSFYASLSQLGHLSVGDICTLGALDFLAHLVMDRVKASPFIWGKYKILSKKESFNYMCSLNSKHPRARYASRKYLAENRYAWWALGFDQAIHHLTDLVVVYLVFSWGL